MLPFNAGRRRRWWGPVFVAAVVSITGCWAGRHPAPTAPMPPNTVLLSTTMQRLSAEPGFTDAVIAQLGHGNRNGAAVMTPELLDRFRKLILGRDWEGLDRFPGWTIGAITPTVHVAGRVLAKEDTQAAVVPASDTAPGLTRLPSAHEVARVLNVGELPLDRATEVDLDQPSRLPGFPLAETATPLGHGVTRGDGPDPQLAGEHAESARLAQLLNRLSVNALSLDGPEGTRLVTAALDGKVADRPESLLQVLIESGHTVEVYDARYYANFGHLHDNGREVMMPFWIDTRIRIPGRERSLLVPVSHAEYQWRVRGPKINADVAFYYGIDGHAEFRTTDELNQTWVLGRHAHTYTGAQALEVTRLVGRVVVAYVHQHVARPGLPFGGYYTLGVCQDAVSAIEKKMTGAVTLFPNTADARLFDDPRDAEVNSLIAAIPKDREGALPEPGRIFGSSPTDDPRAITIPGLADDLLRTEATWHEGTLRRTRTHRQELLVNALDVLGVVSAVGVIWWLIRSRRRG